MNIYFYLVLQRRTKEIDPMKYQQTNSVIYCVCIILNIWLVLKDTELKSHMKSDCDFAFRVERRRTTKSKAMKT